MSLEDGRLVDELRVVDLKSELEKHGLSKIGNKAALASRLKEYLLEISSDESKKEKCKEENSTDEVQPPNAAMMSGGNEFVAKYLQQQRKSLLAGKKAAEEVRAAASESPKKQVDQFDANGEDESLEDVEEREEEQQPAEEECATVEEEEPVCKDNINNTQHMSNSEEEKEETSTPTQIEENAVEEQPDEIDDTELVRQEEEPKPKQIDAEKPQRKRKWARSTNRAVVISSDNLKDVVDVASVKEAVDEIPEDKLELDYDEAVDNEESNEPLSKRIIVDSDEEPIKERSQSIGVKRVVLADEPDLLVPAGMEEQLTEWGVLRQRSPSPPRRTINCIIHIRCLMRPFTLPQLKTLLAKFGTVDDQQFWIDKIKSNCIVKYETSEEASLARDKLHGARWPLSNPKQLRVEFSDQQSLESHKGGGNTEENGKNGRESMGNREPMPDRERKRRSVSPWAVQRTTGREWDKGKDLDRKESPGPREKREGERGSPIRRERREEPLAPPKMLDSLFKKTKALPSIYWVPLTIEQGIERQKAKRECITRVADRQDKLARVEQEEQTYRGRRPSPVRRRR